MFLLIFAKIPKDKYHLLPAYDLGDVPFFETGNKTINIEKYQLPFTKIVFDGDKLFIDDEDYLVDFVKDIYTDPLEEAKAMAALIGKRKPNSGPNVMPTKKQKQKQKRGCLQRSLRKKRQKKRSGQKNWSA